MQWVRKRCTKNRCYHFQIEWRCLPIPFVPFRVSFMPVVYCVLCMCCVVYFLARFNIHLCLIFALVLVYTHNTHCVAALHIGVIYVQIQVVFMHYALCFIRYLIPKRNKKCFAFAFPCSFLPVPVYSCSCSYLRQHLCLFCCCIIIVYVA